MKVSSLLNGYESLGKYSAEADVQLILRRRSTKIGVDGFVTLSPAALQEVWELEWLVTGQCSRYLIDSVSQTCSRRGERRESVGCGGSWRLAGYIGWKRKRCLPG